MNDYIHIFDNTQMPPKQIASIKTTSGPYWITPSIDGSWLMFRPATLST